MEELILNTALTIIRTVVKNKKKAAALKSKLLKIRDAISAAYPED